MGVGVESVPSKGKTPAGRRTRGQGETRRPRNADDRFPKKSPSADEAPEEEDIHAILEREGAEMRREYLAETRLLTARDVRSKSGSDLRGESEPASRWKREKKIFAVRRDEDEVDLYPAFQFEDGAPRPVIESVLAEMPDKLTSWELACWFEAGNGWLDGAPPQECLDRPDEVVYAAQRFADPAVG